MIFNVFENPILFVIIGIIILLFAILLLLVVRSFKHQISDDQRNSTDLPTNSNANNNEYKADSLINQVTLNINSSNQSSNLSITRLLRNTDTSNELESYSTRSNESPENSETKYKYDLEEPKDSNNNQESIEIPQFIPNQSSEKVYVNVDETEKSNENITENKNNKVVIPVLLGKDRIIQNETSEILENTYKNRQNGAIIKIKLSDKTNPKIEEEFAESLIKPSSEEANLISQSDALEDNQKISKDSAIASTPNDIDEKLQKANEQIDNYINSAIEEITKSKIVINEESDDDFTNIDQDLNNQEHQNPTTDNIDSIIKKSADILDQTDPLTPSQKSFNQVNDNNDIDKNITDNHITTEQGETITISDNQSKVDSNITNSVNIQNSNNINQNEINITDNTASKVTKPSKSGKHRASLRGLLHKTYRTIFKPQIPDENKEIADNSLENKSEQQNNINQDINNNIEKVEQKAQDINHEIDQIAENFQKEKIDDYINNEDSLGNVAAANISSNLSSEETNEQIDDKNIIKEQESQSIVKSITNKVSALTKSTPQAVEGQIEEDSEQPNDENKFEEIAKIQSQINQENNLHESIESSDFSKLIPEVTGKELPDNIIKEDNHQKIINTQTKLEIDEKTNDLSYFTSMIAPAVQEDSGSDKEKPDGLLNSIKNKITTFTKITPKVAEEQEELIFQASDQKLQDQDKSDKKSIATSTKIKEKTPADSELSTPIFTPTSPPASANVIRLETHLRGVIEKLLSNKSHKFQISDGLFREIESILNKKDLKQIIEAVENNQFSLAKDQLNQIIEDKNQEFQHWRTNFGKFARLFSLISAPEDEEIAFKSIKKATELDPNDSWNWLAFGYLHRKRQNLSDYQNCLQKSLAMSVGANLSDLPFEIYFKSPKHNPIDIKVYISSTLELAKIETDEQEYQNAYKLLANLRIFFENDFIDKEDEFYITNQIDTLNNLAKAEIYQHKWQSAYEYYQEVLALKGCSGRQRLEVILSAIEIFAKIQIDNLNKEQKFEEACALISVFPLSEKENALHYYLLGNYLLSQQSYENSYEFFQNSLVINEQNQNITGQLKALNGLARCQMEMSNSQLAEEIYEKAQKLIADNPNVDKETLAEINLAMGELSDRQEQYREAAIYFQKAATIYNQIPANLASAQLISNFAARQHQQKNYSSSAELYNSVINMYKTLGEEEVIRNISLEQSKNYLYLGNLDQAAENINRSISLLPKYPNAIISASSQLVLANIAWNTNDIPKAEEKAIIAQEIMQVQKYDQNSIPVFIDIGEFLGRLYLRTGNYNLAINNLNRTLTNIRALGEKKSELKLSLLLATALYETDEIPQTLSLLEEAEKIALEINDSNLCEIRLQIAKTLMKHNLEDQANNILQKLLIDEQESNNQYNLYQINSVLAKYYYAIKDYKKSFELLKVAAGGFKELDKPYELACQYLELALYLYKAGKFPELFKMLNYCESIFSKYHAYNMLAETNLWLARAKVKLGQIQSGSEYFQHAIDNYQKISADLKSGEVLLSLGVLLMRNGKNEEARTNWLRAKNIFSKFEKAEQVTRVNNWLEMFNQETII